MTQTEALKLALEALAYLQTIVDTERGPRAMDAIREALAQPEQEPVAWGVFDGLNLHDTFFTEEEAQEMVRLKGDGSNVKPLYTTPPHRKPLTDVEIWNTYKNLWMFHPAEEPRLAGDVLKFARAIEAAHGIKE